VARHLDPTTNRPDRNHTLTPSNHPTTTSNNQQTTKPKQDPNLRRHAIDLHLRRHDRALRHLAAAGPAHFAAALGLARASGLLRQLVAIVQEQGAAASPSGTLTTTSSAAAGAQPKSAAAGESPGDGPSHQQRLALALAAHAESLQSSRRYDDAAVAFLAAGRPESAVAAYSEGGHWRMALALAGRLGWSKERTQSAARELATTLGGSGQLAEAARVLREYVGDVDGAVQALAAAKEWREALRVAYAEGRCGLFG
jgi:elongator complex protein 1